MGEGSGASKRATLAGGLAGLPGVSDLPGFLDSKQGLIVARCLMGWPRP